MVKSAFEVPGTVTFEQAIALSQSLLEQMSQELLQEPEIEQAISALVSSENGARGFFVTYLTDARALADHPTAGVIRGLQSAPHVVAELLVKNLAMSSAMVIAHQRRQDNEMATNSRRVQQRSTQLIQQLQLPELTTRIDQLSSSAATGSGAYQEFLQRWGYDAEQRQAIQQALESVLTRW